MIILYNVLERMAILKEQLAVGKCDATQVRLDKNKHAVMLASIKGNIP